MGNMCVHEWLVVQQQHVRTMREMNDKLNFNSSHGEISNSYIDCIGPSINTPNNITSSVFCTTHVPMFICLCCNNIIHSDM